MKSFLFVTVLALANIIQAITGFAGGPLAMPICISLVGLNDTRACLTMIFLLATAVVTFQNLKYINVKKLATMILFMIIGMVPGLYLIDHAPTQFLLILYGSIVVLIGIWKMLSKGNKEMPKPLKYGALILAGIMQGMFTSGGPFLAIYATSELKDKNEFRATVSPVWTILNVYLCFNMYRHGMYTPNAIHLTLYSIIPVALAIVIGNIINKKIKQETFLKLVYVLLILSGGTLLFNALS